MVQSARISTTMGPSLGLPCDALAGRLLTSMSHPTSNVIIQTGTSGESDTSKAQLKQTRRTKMYPPAKNQSALSARLSKIREHASAKCDRHRKIARPPSRAEVRP